MNPIIESQRQAILKLAAQRGIINIRVFGSMSRDDAQSDSDVDLLVELKKGKTGLALGGFLIDVSELLNRKVDVVTEQALHPKIRSKILQEAQSL